MTSPSSTKSRASDTQEGPPVVVDRSVESEAKKDLSTIEKSKDPSEERKEETSEEKKTPDDKKPESDKEEEVASTFGDSVEETASEHEQIKDIQANDDDAETGTIFGQEQVAAETIGHFVQVLGPAVAEEDDIPEQPTASNELDVDDDDEANIHSETAVEEATTGYQAWIYKSEHFEAMVAKYKFKSVTFTFSRSKAAQTLKTEKLMKLIRIICVAFKSSTICDKFKEAMPMDFDEVEKDYKDANVVLQYKSSGFVQMLEDYLYPYHHISSNITLKEDDDQDHSDDPQLFSVLRFHQADERLDLTPETNSKPIHIDPKNVGKYTTRVDSIRISPIVLLLFVNMGAYSGDSYNPPCLFSQPSVNNRSLHPSNVDKYARGLYEKDCYYQFNEEFVVFPYMVEYEGDDEAHGVDNIRSVVLPEKTNLQSENKYVATWVSDGKEVDKLFKVFFESPLEVLFPKYLPKGVEKDSLDDHNLRYAIFLEQFFLKFNSFSTVNDWKAMYNVLMKELGLESVFNLSSSPKFSSIWHRCHMMMCCVSKLRISAEEGNHRFVSILNALFNTVLYQSVSEITYNKKVSLHSRDELALDECKLQVSRISSVGGVCMSWPSISKEEKAGRLGSIEMNMTKAYSTLMQDKKDGSVDRNIRDVLTSYLVKVKETSLSEDQCTSDFYEVHRPGSLNHTNFSLENLTFMEYRLHEEPPKAITKNDIGTKETAKSAAKMKASVEKKAAFKSSNKYRNDDNSTGLEARAMVFFREHLMKTILTDNCKEVVDMKRSLEDTYCLGTQDDPKGYDPKNENRPRKLERSLTTPSVLAKHIGYSWTIDRSLQGCMSVLKLSPDSYRPQAIWPLIFLISNFVHDNVTVDLMIKILHSNGMPADTQHPFVMSKSIQYPQLFNYETKSYGTMIVNSFLKPQMMFYDALLPFFQKEYKEAGEINIRNRYMLSIGKSWLQVINKFGLWISASKLKPCHNALKMCMDTKASEFPHSLSSKSEEVGTNLPQVAAYICHLIEKDVFVWSNIVYKGKWKKKTGVFTPSEHPPPSDWDVFVPKFKLGNKLDENKTSGNMRLEDIVEYIILGSYNDGARTLPELDRHKKAWNFWTKDFTVEYCSGYIENNRKPVYSSDEESDDDDDGEEREKRPGALFRSKMFTPSLYVKHFLRGDQEDNDKTRLSVKPNPSNEDIDEYRERLNDMSTAMMEASLYLRFQRELLSIHCKQARDAETKTKCTWKLTDVMAVIQKDGGEKGRPFYHPDYPNYLYSETIDPEMKYYAEACYEKAINQGKGETSGEDDRKVPAICKVASGKGFRVSDKEYHAIGDKVLEEQNRVQIAKEIREKKKRGRDGLNVDQSDEPPKRSRR
jgi:hypothetical protein